MCLILIAWQAHPDYPLVIAANRDEFHARPTRPAGFWPEAPLLLAGRDDAAGGTWLGITRHGRFAALTNYRDPAATDSRRPSRGKLVSDFLLGTLCPEDYLRHSAAYGAACNGYNLLVGTCGGSPSLWSASNVSGPPVELAPGVHGLSNHLLNTSWPKVGAGRTALQAALWPQPEDAALLALLTDEQRPDDAALPATGVPLEWERLLAAAFIRGPGYGTRASTLLKVRRDGRVMFDETSWPATASGLPTRRRFAFNLE